MASRPVFIRRRMVLGSPLLLGLVLLILYGVFCDRAEDFDSVPYGQRAIVIGFVEEVFSVNEGEYSGAYKLQDPTAEVYILSEQNPPREGAILLVWGSKAGTDTGAPVLLEKNRIGDSFWILILFFIKVVSFFCGS